MDPKARQMDRVLLHAVKVAGGPKAAGELQGYRCTVGRYKRGWKFRVIDDWVFSSEPHQRIQEAWVGHTICISNK